MTMIFPVFMGIVVTLFFLLPVKCRPALLFLSSYVFCGWIDMRGLAVLILISIFTWRAGIRLERLRDKMRGENAERGRGKTRQVRGFVIFAVGFLVIVLCVYKYGAWLLNLVFNGNPVSCGGWQAPQRIAASLAMPVGLSFYMFQAIGYLADIYKGKSGAEKNFIYLGCYLAFFPKLVSGPILREQDFLPQLKRLTQVRFGDRGRLSTAFTYMLWGYFMKMVVADRLAVTVNQIFAAPETFDSFWLLLGAFFYTMQIYCDFAGYSYIAIGCGKIFGLDLAQNFKAPYCAVSITDFWRRWHVSLSSWLRDYLYIPLGGNRKGIARKCINTVIVFLVCGMWHGAGIHFAVWGLLHGIYSVIDALVRKAGWKIRGGRLLTFVEVVFAWIFFRAQSLREALSYVGGIFTAGIHPEKWRETAEAVQIGGVEALVIVCGIAVVLSIDELCNARKLNMPVLVQKKENAVRYLIFYLLVIAIFIFGMYGPGYHAEQFIYMQFNMG